LALAAGACSGGERRPAAGGELSGPPVVVGLINMEGAATGSFPELRKAAEAAAALVNRDLGGIGGRPLRIEACASTGTPESSQGCAHRVLESKPVAVMGGIDLGAGATLPVLKDAGVPYVSSSPTMPEELSSQGAFAFTGGTAADLLGQAEYVTATLKPAKVGILHMQLPGLLRSLPTLARLVLNRRGVGEVKVVAEKADAADFTPALKAVSANDPDVIFVVFPAQACARVLQAQQGLRVRARLFFPSVCADAAVVGPAGAAADGAYFSSGFLPFDDPDEAVATWRREQGSAPVSVLAQAGFSTVMNLHGLIGALDGDELTPASVATRLEKARDRDSFMGHPYSCDGKRAPLVTSACSVHVRILQHRGGRFSDVTGDWVSGADLVKLLVG
ncbi:MAG: ABC transporter substrate-binding protein, partial [Acidimicrobiales bacterium]